MKIERYSFGHIVIDGKSYTKDVIILPDRVFHPWWRKEGHYLHWEDLEEVLKDPPEVLYIGRGHSGVMEVPSPLVDKLHAQGIEVVTGRTSDIVDRFNSDRRQKKAAALHLTC
ncbi:MAG: hypothetical protein D6778_10795 [Nitrospirae bacterium]|nr:MAG: hypothetical protein D6778_10795 [Nitrospirota bacterium]